MNEDDYDHTQRISKKLVVEKNIPTICSECGKIFKMRVVPIRDGKEIGASKGVCPDCEEEFNFEDDRTQKIPRNFVDDKSIPSICSSCKTIYKIDTWVVEDGRKVGVTHGLCQNCYEKMKEQLGDNNQS